MWVLQRNRYHGKRQYLFIESICNDPDILAQNYRYKMMYSPDYKTTTEEEVSYCATCTSASRAAPSASGRISVSEMLINPLCPLVISSAVCLASGKSDACMPFGPCGD